MTVQRIKGKKVTVVPILRAGLGMLPGVLDIIPSAKVSVVGLARDDLAPQARFRPHVTLARAAPPRDVTDVLAALTLDDPPRWRCDEALLVHSELGAGEGGRPRHGVLARMAFRQPPAGR